MKKKISIHDIAKELNLSATTISFVLNGKADEKKISEQVQRKVADYIKQVGYQPNMIAKSLRTGKTNIIGMLVEDISDPFFSSISRGIETIAYHHKYKIFFASTENDTEKTKALIKVFRERQVDGYIMAPPSGIEDDIKALIDDNVPVILFDRYLPALNTSTVIIDNFSGAYQAVKHLLENGFSNIAFITLKSDQTQMHSRLQGYLTAMEESGHEAIVQKLPCKLSHSLGAEMVKEFVMQHNNIDAILFATNYLAINGLKAIQDLGLIIPDNIAVIGFDDNTHFNLFSPSITAVAQPIEEIAEEVVQQLINALSDERESKKRRTVTLPVKLIIRNSSSAKMKKNIVEPALSTMKKS
ncbi:MAG: LacI family DNA-binding transcriptional regulator [Chitinophaga sp.]|uniref:LacI family DNA-binding transcriptional regulator n=1 Tax=Chitinophaga sp. TaxID=1869181 RepID=UPI001B0C3CC5|nr:LacI family DNA-binding transcriptional regulator [Chitinophaga sp.]MBO9729794.1 LacI family DNA-binding transcriptional regulator [Chitinophaga sp.]